jgi:hypothetical protein
MKETTFGELLKKYRKRAGFKTLANFANALADEGLIYSDSILSRWQKNSRLPSDRKVYLIIFRILISYGAITNIAQANKLLSAANKGFLSGEEIKELLVKDDLKLTMSLYEDEENYIDNEEKLIRVSLVLPKNLNRYLDWVSNQYSQSKAEIFREIIDKKIKADIYQDIGERS